MRYILWLSFYGSMQAAWANTPWFASHAERCVIPAAQYHSVDPFLLRTVLKVESGLRSQVSKNQNGTVDVGIGQINSIHFNELQQNGVPSALLLDDCVGTYVAAWHLRKVILRHGYTWKGVAHYHSATPVYNERYQKLLKNELIRAGVLAGAIETVPSLAALAKTKRKDP
jgi:Transglycosylase SLT domain